MEHLKDILDFLLSSNDEPINIFNHLLTNLNDIKKGFTFEGLCIILEISKC